MSDVKMLGMSAEVAPLCQESPRGIAELQDRALTVARITMPHPPEHKLRWYQYSLRSLFILTALVAIACSWYANEMFKATERRKAIAEIEKLGWDVAYCGEFRLFEPIYGEPPGWFSWLRRLHGDEYLGNAASVFAVKLQINDARVFYMKDLTRPECQSTQTIDAGLVHLKGLTRLEAVYLEGTSISDAGLVQLKGLTKLEEFDLSGTQITDAGLVHLKGLANLAALQLDDTQITDAGLVHLKGLTELGYLDLNRTQVTNEGIKGLQQALPNCEISH